MSRLEDESSTLVCIFRKYRTPDPASQLTNAVVTHTAFIRSNIHLTAVIIVLALYSKDRAKMCLQFPVCKFSLFLSISIFFLALWLIRYSIIYIITYACVSSKVPHDHLYHEFADAEPSVNDDRLHWSTLYLLGHMIPILRIFSSPKMKLLLNLIVTIQARENLEESTNKDIVPAAEITHTEIDVCVLLQQLIMQFPLLRCIPIDTISAKDLRARLSLLFQHVTKCRVRVLAKYHNRLASTFPQCIEHVTKQSCRDLFCLDPKLRSDIPVQPAHVIRNGGLHTIVFNLDKQSHIL